MKRYIKADNDIFDRIAALGIDPFGSFKDRERLAYLTSDPDLLEIYVTDPSESVRRAVANNPFVPESCLASLAEDRSVAVRATVARNPSTPANILVTLASDPDIAVRADLADRQDIPEEACKILSNDPSYVVLSNLLQNSHTPADVLDYVIHNPPAELSYRENNLLQFFAAKNENTAAETLEYLVTSGDYDTGDHDILDRIAMHENANPETLDILSRSPDKHIRWRVTLNDNTSNETLMRLCDDEYSPTRDSARMGLLRRSNQL